MSYRGAKMRCHYGAKSIPKFGYGAKLLDALNPDLAPKPVKSFADMTDEEKAKMRALYERKP